MPSPISDRLSALRECMRSHDVSACIVPSADPHLSEYLPAHWQAREWLSGFTGSAGTLVVAADFAGLWTDSRYFEQAERELADSSITLMRLNVPHTPEHVDWLVGRLGAGERVAAAGDMLSLSAAAELQERLAHIDAELVLKDVVADIWPERPSLPAEAVIEHPVEYAVRGRADKLAEVRAGMRSHGATHHLVSALDDIAWISNLRGRDVPYNPVFLAHLLIDGDQATLYVASDKIDKFLREALEHEGFGIDDYAAIGAALEALPADARLLLDPQRVAVSIAGSLPQAVVPVHSANPSTALKACKSPAELAHIRETMRQDGVALVRFARWLDESISAGAGVTEMDVDERLRTLRSERPGFVSESFATIAGYMANGASPHYRATAEHHAALHSSGLLLVDSGGQYLGGTTDITRMWALGETTSEQRHDVTRVLKGVIALSSALFPAGSSGQQLDALARAPIWAAGIDYGHGTGHGVGYALNVHEGPQAIRPPRAGALEPLLPGMVTSIEPGIYKTGRHGVRIENLAATVTMQTTEFGDFLGFETLTLCPIDVRAVDTQTLNAEEKTWLNDYHARVMEQLAPLLESGERDWLARRCAPV